MEEEFQGGVCGGNWWNSSRNLFASSPCSSAINDLGWFNHGAIVDMKTARSISDNSAGTASGTASDRGSSVVLGDLQKPQQPITNGNMSFASTLQMMGIYRNSSSSASDDLNQDLLHDSGRSQENYSHILQALTGLDSSMNLRRKTADDMNFCADSSINSFKQVNQHQSNYFTNSTHNFPLDYSYPSSLLFDADSQAQQSSLDNEATNYSSSPNFPMNSTEFLPLRKHSLPKQQHANNFQFVNNTPFWNATAAASGEVRPSFLPSTQPQIIPSALSKPKVNPDNLTAKHHNLKLAGDTDSGVKKGGNETSFKRPRIETPSPLPTFKVRKEKLGDRVTALQQLVSPFGKTDTASVLHEAIEYIKLLHDQVAVLSTPYLKNECPPLQRQQAGDKIKGQEEPMKDLKSRGLCLVPISSTFPVAAETTADFWTPTFGGSFR